MMSIMIKFALGAIFLFLLLMDYLILHKDFRMGLAISLVATCKEKVWYHSKYNNRGRGWYNTNLTDYGGCCIWYDEPNLMSDVEEHLDVTIDRIQPDMKVPINEFDGKVTYGDKHKAGGSIYKGHVDFLSPTASELAQLEKKAQTTFIDLKFKRKFADISMQ